MLTVVVDDTPAFTEGRDKELAGIEEKVFEVDQKRVACQTAKSEA